MSEVLKERQEIDSRDKWAIEDLYADDILWEKDLAYVKEGIEELKGYEGRLDESVEAFAGFINLYKKVNMIFEKVGIKADGEAFDTRFRELLHEGAEPVENAGEMLGYLSEKYPVYAVSNAFHNKQAIRLEKAGMLRYIKKVFISGQVGYLKPSKEFFDICIKEASVEPGEVLIIGDSLTADISGGINYGLKTCWFNYKNEPLPDSIKPDFVVNSLDEIKNLF